VTDYRAWCLKNGNDYKVCEAPAHRISTADLDKVAKDQGVELRIGDILFLRTGYIEWYNNSDTEERVRVAKKYPPDIAGIEQTEESVRWLWYNPFASSMHMHTPNYTPVSAPVPVSPSSCGYWVLRYSGSLILTRRDHHFAAVAADNTSVELRPTMASWNIHDYLLPMWGTPVGELFDLEPLSQMCQKLGRYSFFVTSAPLNVKGGIACMTPALPPCPSPPFAAIAKPRFRIWVMANL